MRQGSRPPALTELTSVEEHVSYNGRTLVYLQRMAAQHNALAHDSVWINLVQGASCHQYIGACTHTHTREKQAWCIV